MVLVMKLQQTKNLVIGLNSTVGSTIPTILILQQLIIQWRMASEGANRDFKKTSPISTTQLFIFYTFQYSKTIAPLTI